MQLTLQMIKNTTVHTLKKNTRFIIERMHQCSYIYSPCDIQRVFKVSDVYANKYTWLADTDGHTLTHIKIESYYNPSAGW